MLLKLFSRGGFSVRIRRLLALWLLSFICAISLFLLDDSGVATAGTLNATLGDDGIVQLSGSESFECVPEGATVGARAIVSLYSTPLYGSGQILGGAESGSSSVSFNVQHNLSCKYPGNYTYRVTFSGGKWQTDYLGRRTCVMSGSPAVDAVVLLPLGRESSILLPTDRVQGVETVSVAYRFPYTSSSCYDSGSKTDPCLNRTVTVSVGTQSIYWNNGKNGLPLSGTVSVPYDFSKITTTAPTVIKAQLSCGTGRTTEKLVYREPDDLGKQQKKKCNRLLVGKPVHLAKGNVYLSETDFSLPGVMPVIFSRHYNSSASTGAGEFGYGILNPPGYSGDRFV